MRIVIRADASPKIGGGHIYRTTTLGRAFSGLGWDVVYATRVQSFEIVHSLSNQPFRFVLLRGSVEDEVEALRSEVGFADLLVVDHYDRGYDFEMACHAIFANVLVLDDQPTRIHYCDFLLDQTLGRRPEEYHSLVPENSRVIVGPQHALLRPQFAEVRRSSLSARDSFQKLLILVGASDPFGLTAWALGLVAESGLRLEIDVISRDADLRRRFGSKCGSCRVVFHEHVVEMAALMAEADVAIGAAGSASWERCCLGLPSLLFVLAENQREICEALAVKGAAMDMGPFPGASEEQFVEALRHLHSNPNKLTLMSRRASEVCDGLGCRRVMKMFLNSAPGKARAIPDSRIEDSQSEGF